MASPLIRSVKEFVEVKLLSYTFKFKRLTWVDYFGLSSVEDFRKKVLTVALTEVSGKLLTPDEATTLISSLPPVIIEKVYTIFLGSLDDRRKFSSIDLPQGPDTKDFTHYLQEEGTKKGKIMDEVERQIEMKFGREALEEEKALSNQLLKNSGHKGVTNLTKDSLDKLNGVGS